MIDYSCDIFCAMIRKEKITSVIGVLLGLGTIITPGISLSSTTQSPCPEIFQYEQASDGEWKANLTLISDSDLHGLWVRLLTEPKLKDVTFSEGFDLKYDETSEVRITSREYFLEANTPKSFTLSGKLIDGKTPELLRIVFNGKTICSSYKINGNLLYGGDINNKQYLSSIVQNRSNKNVSNYTGCGVVPFNSIVYPQFSWIPRYNQFPWQGGLYSGDSLICEATLISEDALLTSAHCVAWQKTRRPISPSLLKVKLKHVDVRKGNNELLQLKSVIIHPEFNEKNLENDIAIVKLMEPLTLDNNTVPACLPTSDEIFEYGFILGYAFNKNRTLNGLRITGVDVITEKRCKELEPQYKNLMNTNNFCAVYVDILSGSCVGGSGSGYFDLLFNPWMGYKLDGIVSIGRGLHETYKCGDSSPVVVVRVYRYLKWIRSHLN